MEDYYSTTWVGTIDPPTLLPLKTPSENEREEEEKRSLERERGEQGREVERNRREEKDLTNQVGEKWRVYFSSYESR